MDAAADNNNMPGRGRTVAAWLALFALGVLQLGTFLHQEQHSVTDLDVACVACVHFDQFDDLVPASLPTVVVASYPTLQPAPPTDVEQSRFIRVYLGRAPPRFA